MKLFEKQAAFCDACQEEITHICRGFWEVRKAVTEGSWECMKCHRREIWQQHVYDDRNDGEYWES